MSMKKMQPEEKEERGKAMQAVVGIWKVRPEFSDPVNYVRRLRRDTRLKRLYKDDPDRLRPSPRC